MSEFPLGALALSLAAAAPDFTLDSATLTTALAGGATVPEGIDTDLAKAFQTAGGGPLVLRYAADAISSVTADGFSVTGVQLDFIGVAVSGATVIFGLDPDHATVLRITVEISPDGWTWTDLTPAAAGWPFDCAQVSDVSFTFDTLDAGAIQTMAANLVPPVPLGPVAALVAGLVLPGGVLPLAGALDFAAVDGASVCLPAGRLTAPLITSAPLTLFGFLTVDTPRIRLILPAADAGAVAQDPQRSAAADDPGTAAAPSLDLAIDTMVGATGGTPVTCVLSATVPPDPPATATSVDFVLEAAAGAAPLSPGAIAGLVGGRYYFQDVPAELQAYLTSVDLIDLVFTAHLDPPTLTSIVATLGTPQPIGWNPLNDSTNALSLTFDAVSLVWTIDDSGTTPTSSAVFSATAALLPAIFPGSFGFTISTDLTFHATYQGSVTLGGLVDGLSAGQISLPSGTDIALSDVVFDYSRSAGTYALTAQLQADLDFLTIAGTPLLAVENASFVLAASPPAQSGAGNAGPALTIYDGSFTGSIAIGAVDAAVTVQHRSGGVWALSATLVEPVALSDLVDQFLGPLSPSPFLPGNILVSALTIDAQIAPEGANVATTYTVAGTFSWTLTLGNIVAGPAQAQVSLLYDAGRDEGERYTSTASTTVVVLGASVGIAYSFADANSTLRLSWEGAPATYTAGDDTLIFAFPSISIGGAITALMRTIDAPYVTLSSPWDLLDQVALDGLEIGFALAKNAPTAISATYTLPSAIDLGFATISGLTVARVPQAVGKPVITLALAGDSPLLYLPGVDPRLLKLFGRQASGPDLADAAPAGQDVQDLPGIAGRGNDLLSIDLLIMGQRVGVTGMTDATSVTQVIGALIAIPGSDGDANPVVPASATPPAVQYARSSDWLIASHMQMLKTDIGWTVELGFVFHDSDFYGLHLEMAGGKAKALAGLAVDILYKKVTDRVGLYQIDWRFPDSVRTLDFGAVSVVLPDIGVQIYTNGDFMIDIGFPRNMDFSRSFAFSAIIAGLPVTGGGGVYFGKLSGATSTVTPVTTLGTFDPVIAFGIGFQLGLGYSFTAGPLSAGFSLTAVAMIEGVIASWHPYLPPAQLGNSVQHDYYFKLIGTVGLIGLLYGSVDFAIVRASLSINITLTLTIAYESFQSITISADVSVSVALTVRIDLGLFSISFDLSFHTDVHCSFMIQVDDGTAPWLPPPGAGLARPTDRTLIMLPMPTPRGEARPRLRSAGDVGPVLDLYATVAYTVVAAEGDTDPAAQTGAFVAVLMMDAPSQSGVPATGATSFETLCANLLPWLVGHLGGDAARLTPAILQAYMDRLADLADPPLDFDDYLSFLSGFTINLHALTAANQRALDPGSVPVPPIDGLIATPSLNGMTGQSVDFSRYVIVPPGYRDGVAALFASLAAELEIAGAQAPSRVILPRPSRAAAEIPRSMAAMLFVDMMMLTGRQLLQAACNAFRRFDFALATADTLEAILDWSRTSGTADGLGITVDDIVLPNAATPLAAGVLLVPAAAYTIRNDDSLATIAQRFAIEAADLIAGNPDARVVSSGIAIPVNGGSFVTPPAISFAELLNALGRIEPATAWTPAQLATAIGTMPALIAGQQLHVRRDPLDAGLSLAVAAGDTLAAIAARYGTTVSAIGAVPVNQTIPLFDAATTPSIPLDNVTQASSDALWTAICDDDQLATIAGIVTRFMTAGVRLPVTTAQGALSLSAAFTANTSPQGEYGLYQLTGQQFPAAAAPVPAAGEYSLTVSSLPGHLTFVSFDTAAGSVVDLVDPLARLGPVLACAQAGAFDPPTDFRILPAVARAPRTWPLSTGVGFVAADPTAIGLLTIPPTEPLQPERSLLPMLWRVPQTLLADAASRTRRLNAAGVPYAAQLSYCEALDPEALTVDPISKAPVQTPLGQYCWATRIGFSVRRLPPATAGAAFAKTRGFTYEVMAPDATQASLLEQLVSALGLNDSGAGTDAPISGLYLAYAQGSGKDAQLLAPEDPAAPAFFSRTTLSTQANPAPATAARDADPPAPAPPIGNIANPPDQVAQLLWELSTVRSGGYFLTWDRLPASAFDATGKADLVLLFCYPRGGALIQDRLTAFVNAVLTDDPAAGVGVQVALESSSAATPAQPVAGASLAQMAALYRLSVGRIAELNATFPLLPGVAVQIGGVTHLVTPADAGAADAWDAIAASYPPLTGTQISAANPGVGATAGTALYLPPIPYGTVAGDTLASLAGRYGISVDDLATGVADAAMLTSPGTGGATLTIDPQALDVRPGDASGNVTFELTRPAPDPTDISPGATLAQLFTLLGTGLVGNRYFAASRGAPIGPQPLNDPMDATATRRAAEQRRVMADPVRRRALLVAAADTAPRCYRQTFGLLSSAQTNVAPTGGGAGQPLGADSPYRGVGTLAQLELGWRDLFGNRLIDQFAAPSPQYSGAVNGQIVPLLYRDTLIGPASWPNFALHYAYAAGELAITLSFLTAAYLDPDSGQAAAVRDTSRYTRIWYQLNQDYGTNTSPWASGEAVGFALHTDLLAVPDLALGDAQAQIFRDFVDQILAYLAAVQAGRAGTPPLAACLSIPASVDAVAPGNILPLTMTLTLCRQGLLVDSALAGLADGERASIDILPMPDSDADAGSGYSQFAAQFEAMFVAPADGWSLRVGTSPASGAAADVGDRRTQSMWAVRMADAPLSATSGGLGFTLADLPLYYAPLPLATHLVSDDFALYPAYDGTQNFPPAQSPVTRSFTGIDPNVWFQLVLDAIDAALAPDLAAALYLFDRSRGIADPLTDGALAQLLMIKAALAGSIAASVQPIFASPGADSPWPTPDPASRQTACETLRQALLDRLGPAFSTTAITVFQADAVSGGAVTLYGKPRATLAETAAAGANATFALSTTRLPLDPTSPARLGFLVDSRNVATSSAAYLSLEFEWAITHVEHAIRSVPGIAGYTDSDWIAFVTPFAPRAFNPDSTGTAQAIDVPVVLRALPQPPTMQAQSGNATDAAATTPDELAQWDYRVDFAYDRAAQDSIATEIDFNIPPEDDVQADDADPASTLQAALAQFVQVYPAVLQAMTTALDAIADDGAAPAAATPVQWFIALLSAVSQAHDAWARSVVAFDAPTSLPPETKLAFEIELVPANPTDPAAVAVNGLTINGYTATLDANRTTITAPGAGLTLPVPFIEIAPVMTVANVTGIVPDPWTTTITSVAGQDSIRFGYTAGATPVTYQQVVAAGTRSIVMRKLSIFGYRNGQTSLQILRNAHLLPDSAPSATTSDAFVFRTPVVRFASPLAPDLSFASLDMDGLLPAGSSYEGNLEAVFAGLAGGVTGTVPVEAAATVTYAYSLVPGAGMPRTVVPILLMPVTSAVIESGTTPDFVGQVAAAVDGWRTDHQPTTGGGATIDMALAIYPAGDGDRQPILRVERIHVTAADTPPAGR